VDDFSYDISPDGTEVAFSADLDKSGVDENYDIILLPSCGCKPAKDVTPQNPANDSEPRYSPMAAGSLSYSNTSRRSMRTGRG